MNYFYLDIINVMRHKGNISEVMVDRNRYLRSIYIQLTHRRYPIFVRDRVNMIANMECDRHYISEERAYVVINHYLLTGKVLRASHYKQMMYASLIEEYKDVIRDNPGLNNIRMAIELSIARPATCPGVSPERIINILRDMQVF